MLGKFDSYRDSALHYLCSSDWGNDSFGDVSTYGVYIWRISNKLEDVNTGATEINSVLEDWETANPELLGTLECSMQEFRTSLAGHFMVSENEQGQVTVKEFVLESELIRHFTNMQAHYNKFIEELEEDE